MSCYDRLRVFSQIVPVEKIEEQEEEIERLRTQLAEAQDKLQQQETDFNKRMDNMEARIMKALKKVGEENPEELI